VNDFFANNRSQNPIYLTAGNIDVLVLNHIGQSYLGGYRYNVEDVEKLMMANVLTHAHMSDLAMPSLIKKKGRISVVSTALGLVQITIIPKT